ncbi:addiction module antidote protein [Pseudomonas sp. NPDC089547]|uniref:addiction module antidote protein n=1 Tax=Pseudomonas sp. NPDC089547 TaxID=3390652 RepID=UPI003D0178E7
MSEKLIPFDMAALLTSDEAICEYLSQVLSDGDTEEVIRALGHIVRARGMTQIAADSDLGREGLYNALSPSAKPRFDDVLKVIRALGFNLHVQPQVVPR